MGIKGLPAMLAAATLFFSGCALFRWSGSPDPELAPNWYWSTGDLVISTQPAPSPPPAPVLPEKLPDTLYYTDLGPDTIDASGYPAQQKYNYAVFARECARCHTLARAINSPVESRLYWHYHIVRMSLHSRLQREPRIARADAKAILDFLEYDAQVRKVQNRRSFDESNEELKRRFEPILKGLLDRMGRAAGSQPDAPAGP